MSARKKVLELVSGWQAVELVLKCIFVGIWQVMQIGVKILWKGHRRKSKDSSPVELTVDSSVGTHCYIKIADVKYHYVETGPKSGQTVLILGDAPDAGRIWCPNWTNVVRRLAESGHHVVTLDVRGTGGSEGGSRSDLAPPRVVEELSMLLEALGVSEMRPAVVIGFGIGGMLTWYLVHCYGPLVSRFAVIKAPHPNLYWQYPPAEFCHRALHFIQVLMRSKMVTTLDLEYFDSQGQLPEHTAKFMATDFQLEVGSCSGWHKWPFVPERWLAEGEISEGDGRWSSTRACDWSGALNYVRGAAWWRINTEHKVSPAALLVGGKNSAAQLVSSAAYCSASTLRLVEKADPTDNGLSKILLDFLLGTAKEKLVEDVPRGLVGRMLGAVAGRGRELTGLTARLVLPPPHA